MHLDEIEFTQMWAGDNKCAAAASVNKTKLLKALHPSMLSSNQRLLLFCFLLISHLSPTSLCSTFFQSLCLWTCFLLFLLLSSFNPSNSCASSIPHPSLCFLQVPWCLLCVKPISSPLFPPSPLSLFAFFSISLPFSFFLFDTSSSGSTPCLHFSLCVFACVRASVCANELRAVSLPRWGTMLRWSTLLELQVSTTNTCLVEHYCTYMCIPLTPTNTHEYTQTHRWFPFPLTYMHTNTQQ